MKKTAKIPRIIRINSRKGFLLSVAFNNGEHRLLDFVRLFQKWGYADDPLRSKLLRKEFFKTVQVHEGTLQWPGVLHKTRLPNGMEFEVAFDLDPVVLYEESTPDEDRNQVYHIGHMIRRARKEAGLTQEELARRSGTTKNYISRIENNKSDIELGTLIKIVEIGLNKRLDIQVN